MLAKLEYEMPQGSVLGPILFVLYTQPLRLYQTTHAHISPLLTALSWTNHAVQNSMTMPVACPLIRRLTWLHPRLMLSTGDRENGMTHFDLTFSHAG